MTNTANPLRHIGGEGTTSSSDGQQFRAGGRGEQAGQVNLRYGTEPGVLFYTHISDQYAPFHTKVINGTVRDATHVGSTYPALGTPRSGIWSAPH